MKLIIAVIQPHKLDEVMQALEEVNVNLMTVTNALGRGRQKGVTEIYRGAKEVGSLLKKVKLEIAVNEDFVEPTIQAIVKGAHTGEMATERFLFSILVSACASAPASGAA